MITVYYYRSCYGNMGYNESIQFYDIEGLRSWVKKLDSSFNCERVSFNLSNEYQYIYIRVGTRLVIGETSRLMIERIENEEGILFDKSINHCSRQIKKLFEDLKNINSEEKVLIY